MTAHERTSVICPSSCVLSIGYCTGSTNMRKMYTYVCTRVRMRLRAHAHAHTQTPTYMNVCVHMVFVYAYIHVYIYICICIYARMYVCIHACMRACKFSPNHLHTPSLSFSLSLKHINKVLKYICILHNRMRILIERYTVYTKVNVYTIINLLPGRYLNS